MKSRIAPKSRRQPFSMLLTRVSWLALAAVGLWREGSGGRRVRSTLGLSERSAARNYVPGPTTAKGLPSQLTLPTGALDRWIHSYKQLNMLLQPNYFSSVHKATRTSTITTRPPSCPALVGLSSCANPDSKPSSPLLATHPIARQHPSIHPNSVTLLTLGFLVPKKIARP